MIAMFSEQLALKLRFDLGHRRILLEKTQELCQVYVRSAHSYCNCAMRRSASHFLIWFRKPICSLVN